MILELTEQQRQGLLEHNGSLVEIMDPQSKRVYVLLPREQFEQVRALLPAPATLLETTIPEGIRLSRLALCRDLPGLLAKPKLRNLWVAYHRDERIGTAKDARALIRQCLRRGLPSCEYYIGIIDEAELIEEEELGSPPPFLTGDPPVEEMFDP